LQRDVRELRLELCERSPQDLLARTVVQVTDCQGSVTRSHLAVRRGLVAKHAASELGECGAGSCCHDALEVALE
jgi:hypothetical protein